MTLIEYTFCIDSIIQDSIIQDSVRDRFLARVRTPLVSTELGGWSLQMRYILYNMLFLEFPTPFSLLFLRAYLND